MAAVGSYTKVAVFFILTLYFMSNWQFILGGNLHLVIFVLV
jgi:hypothetical protein